MPVIVETPIHLTVDEEALRRTPHEIEAALDRALRAVLARSRADVLEDRGGYMGVRLREPEFTWSGLPVDSATRERLEASARELISQAAEGAGLFDLARQTEKLSPPLTSDSKEVRDLRRHSDVLQRYIIPRYNDGETETVPIDAPLGPELTETRHFYLTDIRSITLDNVRQTLMDMGVTFPLTEPVAILAKLENHVAEYFLGMFGVDGRHAFTDLRGMTHWEFTPGPPGRFEEKPGGNLSPENGTIERIDFGANHDLNAEVLRPVIEQSIRNRIGQIQMPEGMTSDEKTVAIEQAVSREILRRATGYGANAILVVIRNGGTPVIASFPGSLAPRIPFVGTAKMVTFSYTEYAPADGDSEGGGNGSGDGASGTGSRGGGGTGNGTGGSSGGGGRRGGFVYTGQSGSGESGAIFPSMPGEGEARQCEAFMDEPTCDELGPIGATMWTMIQQIAVRLDMEPCAYPCNFSLMAAERIAGHAMNVSRYAAVTGTEFTQHVPSGTGNMGTIEFHPTASPAIQFMRHLSGTVPLVGALMRLINDAYPVHSARVTRNYFSNIYSWLLRYMIAYGDAMDHAVQIIFEQSCRVLMLQFLETSRQQIQGRLDNFAQYAPIFEMLMMKWLREPAELTELRDRLRRHEAARWVSEHAGSAADSVLNVGGNRGLNTALAFVPGSPQNVAVTWLTAARGLAGAFTAVEQALETEGAAGDIYETGGVSRIRDAHGHSWTMSELEQAIVTRRGEAEDIDPLVKQIRDLPDVFERFRLHPREARRELRKLLTEMVENNAEMTRKTISDPSFAFEMSSMVDNIPQATIRGSRYALQGIHLQVHLQIGEFFRGDPYYARGVDQAISSYLGREAIVNFVLAVGIVALCVFCAPLGFIAGIAVASRDVARAEERGRMFGALIDPELVLTRAEVEVGLFAAYLGLALSFIPEAGTILGAARQGIKGGVRVGVVGGVRMAGRYIARSVTRSAVASLSREFLPAFITQLAQDQVMNLLIQQALEPLLARYQREMMITQSVGGNAGARGILLMLASDETLAPTAAVRRGL